MRQNWQSKYKCWKKELQGIIRQLADKQEKLQTADRQLIELKKGYGSH